MVSDAYERSTDRPERAEEHLEEIVGEQGHQRSDADANAAPTELSSR